MTTERSKRATGTTAGGGRRRPGRPSGGDRVIDREQMLDRAEEVIRRDGAAVSLEAIARHAGVTKPIVYARVGGRTEVANALAARLTDRMLQSSGAAVAEAPEWREALQVMVRVALEVVEEHRDLFLYVTAGHTPSDRLSLASLIAGPMSKDLGRWGSAHGVPTETTDAWAWAIVGMINFVALWWITESDRTAEDLAGQLADLLWGGLSRHGRPPDDVPPRS